MIDDDFRKLTDMFERMFQDITVDLVPILLGWCNCCFLQSKGHFVKYRYTNGELVDLFICLDCRSLGCEPEGDCKIEGCSFAETHDKYVTKKNKN